VEACAAERHHAAEDDAEASAQNVTARSPTLAEFGEDTDRLAEFGEDIDPRLALLARASAWLVLIEQGAATLDEALEALTPAFAAAVSCDRDREMLARWERRYPPRPLPSWRSKFRRGAQ
jgi:hypothetical protein